MSVGQRAGSREPSLFQKMGRTFNLLIRLCDYGLNVLCAITKRVDRFTCHSLNVNLSKIDLFNVLTLQKRVQPFCGYVDGLVLISPVDVRFFQTR